METCLRKIGYLVILLLVMVACEKSSNKTDQVEFIKDANSLALFEKGFYSQSSFVTVAKDISEGQNRLQLLLNDPQINPYRVDIYLEDEESKMASLKSGKYEVLFLKGLLIVTDLLDSKIRYSFKVANSETKALESRLPNDLKISNVINTIGISVFGEHNKTNKNNSRTAVEPPCLTSGGAGSTSCSNTCCSVSCTTGYYASCSSTCHCYKNDPPK